MPRSKLGLKLSVERLCQKHKFNPVTELILELKRDKVSKERIAGLTVLINKMRPNPKSVEVVSDQDRKIEIVRNTFTLPSPANGGSGTVLDISPDPE